jgi:hypothetical protein
MTRTPDNPMTILAGWFLVAMALAGRFFRWDDAPE